MQVRQIVPATRTYDAPVTNVAASTSDTTVGGLRAGLVISTGSSSRPAGRRARQRCNACRRRSCGGCDGGPAR
jgi:hypothetical protein